MGFVLGRGLLAFGAVVVVNAALGLWEGEAAKWIVAGFGYSLVVFLSGAAVGTVVQVVGTAILKRTVVANVVSGIVAGLIMMTLSVLLLSSFTTTDAISATLFILLVALESVVVAVTYGAGYGRYHRG